MTSIDRRQLIKRASAAGVAAGAVWVAPSVLGSSSAFAAGSCLNHAGLYWNGANSTTFSPTGVNQPLTSSTRQFVASIPASGSSPAVKVTVTVEPLGTPGTGTGTSDPNPNGGICHNPDSGNNILNGYNSYYALQMRNNANSEGYTVTFAFTNAATNAPINVYNLNFTFIDIDRNSNGYRDTVVLTNTAFTYSNRGSRVTGVGSASDPFRGANSAAEDTTTNVTVNYAGPMNTMQFSYTGTEFHNNSQQIIAISNLTWCY